jgi:predicted phosphodiesterase
MNNKGGNQLLKILVYSDIHLGANFINRQKFVQTIGWVNDLASKEDADAILNLGDLLDCSGGQRKYITPEISSILDEVDLSQHIILVGNHEFSKSGNLLLRVKAKKIISNVEISFSDCAAIPYKDRYSDEDNKTLNNIIDCNIIFAHAEFIGLRFENNYLSKKTFDIIQGRQYRMLILGHYHLRQCANKILCVGSLVSRRKSQEKAMPSATLVNTETLECMEFVNPYGDNNFSESIINKSRIAIEDAGKIDRSSLKKFPTNKELLAEFLSKKYDNLLIETVLG